MNNNIKLTEEELNIAWDVNFPMIGIYQIQEELHQ